MPTSVGPNTKGEENLVFGYDLGDVSNSYKGEPTTNLITHVLPNGNWNTNGSGVIITQNYGYDHNGVLRSSKIMDNPSSGNASFAYTSAFNVSAGTYTFSAMVKTSSANASSNSQMTLYNMNPITLLGSFSFTNLTPGVWTKVSVTGTLASGTTHIAPHFYSFAGDGTNFIEVVDVQLEQKSHATPFAGANGTRSATQGLQDLTGNSTIDLTNVSFDSNAQMTFDGTNDYIAFSDNIYDVADEGTIDELTISAWVNWNQFCASSTFDEIISWWQGGANTYLDGFLGTSKYTVIGDSAANPGIRFGDGWTNTGYNFTAATDVNKWWNIVGVKTVDNAYLYVNGQLEATKGSPLSWGFNGVATIGKHSSGGTEYLDGKIGIIKLYNRALTASEIKSNFNALKSRFNI